MGQTLYVFLFSLEGGVLILGQTGLDENGGDNSMHLLQHGIRIHTEGVPLPQAVSA